MALNNLQELICYRAQPTYLPIKLDSISVLFFYLCFSDDDIQIC